MTITSKTQLIQKIHLGMTVDYLFFWGHQPGKVINQSCFSQWYNAAFSLNNQNFYSAEQYMMYRKAMLFDDHLAAEKILTTASAKTAKAIGRTVTGFDPTYWDKYKFDIVVSGNMAKFSQHPELAAFLVQTQDRILVEASPVDSIWGIGLAQDHPDAKLPAQWPGENLLGFALMQVRTQLANSHGTTTNHHCGDTTL